MISNHEELQLDHFLLLSSENMQSAAQIKSLIYQCIKEIDDHWLHLLFGSHRHIDNRSVCSLMINAHNFFRAATSLVFAGHPTPVYPLLRTSMESALYAAMISCNLGLESIWLNRHENDESRANCRRTFTTPKLFDFFKSKNPALAEECKILYETYIDHGAHPNVHGTFTFIKPVPEISPNALAANYLQGNSLETRIAAFQTFQVAEAGLHLALIAMPHRTEICGTKSFLESFSPHIGLGVFGLEQS